MELAALGISGRIQQRTRLYESSDALRNKAITVTLVTRLRTGIKHTIQSTLNAVFVLVNAPVLYAIMQFESLRLSDETQHCLHSVWRVIPLHRLDKATSGESP